MKLIFIILPLYQVTPAINLCDGDEGNLKKCMPLAVPSLSYNVLKHPKAAHSLPFVIFFAEAKERVCVSFLLSACFFMIQYSREKSSMKYSLSST